MNAGGEARIERGDVARFLIALTVFAAVSSYAALAFIPALASPPPGTGWTRNIGAACVKTNATAYKCAVTSADSGIDFTQVGVQLVSGDGTVRCSFAAGFAMNSGCMVSSPAGAGQHFDNGDSMFGAGDDFHFAPLYVPTATNLAGMTFKLSGGGAAGAAPLN